jgi:hypothetical protein
MAIPISDETTVLDLAGRANATLDWTAPQRAQRVSVREGLGPTCL